MLKLGKYKIGSKAYSVMCQESRGLLPSFESGYIIAETNKDNRHVDVYYRSTPPGNVKHKRPVVTYAFGPR